MAKVLGFEDQVEELLKRHQAFSENEKHGSKSKHDQGFLHYIRCLARQEYNDRGFNASDLRRDTPTRLGERADILAMVTAPVDLGEREARAVRITNVLREITSGDTVYVAQRYHAPVEVTAELSRVIFGVLSDYESDQSLTIQYDTPLSERPFNGEPLVTIDLSDLGSSPGH